MLIDEVPEHKQKQGVVNYIVQEAVASYVAGYYDDVTDEELQQRLNVFNNLSDLLKYCIKESSAAEVVSALLENEDVVDYVKKCGFIDSTEQEAPKKSPGMEDYIIINRTGYGCGIHAFALVNQKASYPKYNAPYAAYKKCDMSEIRSVAPNAFDAIVGSNRGKEQAEKTAAEKAKAAADKRKQTQLDKARKLLEKEGLKVVENESI